LQYDASAKAKKDTRTRTTTTTTRGCVLRVAGRHFTTTTTTTNTIKYYYYIHATYSNSDDDGHCPKLPCQRSSGADANADIGVDADVTSEQLKRGMGACENT